MERSLRSLLDGAIDYAGVFPPAKLDLGPALTEYLSIRDSDNAWIMSRFACPTHALSHLNQLLHEAKPENQVPITVIAAPCHDHDAWQTRLETDARTMSDFERHSDNYAVIEAYETPLPEVDKIDFYVADLGGFTGIEVLLELPWKEGFEDGIAWIAETDNYIAKARLGGATAAAFPSNELVAKWIVECTQLNVPYKFTAGLHHPMPVIDKVTEGRMHGFLNVLVANAVCLQNDLTIDEVVQILANEDADNFNFSSLAMNYKGQILNLEQIEESRDIFYGWGSCSIEEPLQDLADLGFGEMVSA